MKIRIWIGLALTCWASGAGAAPACGPDALGTSRTHVVGTTGGVAVGLKSYPRTLPLADHEVVLTFDDGPAATTPRVLDALAHECVHATFFLIGRNTQAMPALVKRAVDEGHTLGHHTFSHPARTLRRMEFDAAMTEIDKGFAADDFAAYGASTGAPKVKFFRFPGFADTPALDRALMQRDIAIFGADLWADDWLAETPERELELVMRRLDAAKRGIVLLHDSRGSTARMLPALLRTLKAGGYRIVHLVPGPGVPQTVAAPEGWTSTTDPIIAAVFDHEARHRVRTHAVPAWLRPHIAHRMPQRRRNVRGQTRRWARWR